MSKKTQDPSVVRDLVIAVFGLHGRLVETGNSLVQHLGLSTAWWQVLGALGYSAEPLPVAQIARRMGLSRQSVQRVVDLLAERGLVRFEANPRHQRAKLVVLTAEGRSALGGAEAAEAPLNRLVFERIGGERIVEALCVVTEMNTVIAQAIDTDTLPFARKDAA